MTKENAKIAILTITFGACIFYAMMGIKSLSRLEVKVQENTSRIERLECEVLGNCP